jgi:hypothetical protein
VWAGVLYDTLLERDFDYIALSGGAQIFLPAGMKCEFPLGTYLKVTYTEIDGKKFARGIWQADSFHSQDTTP